MRLEDTDSKREVENAAEQIMENLRENKPEKIGNYKVEKIRDYEKQEIYDLQTNKTLKIDLPKSNVLYYELSNKAWVAVRPSGTEPKIKYYIGVKGNSLEDAENKLNNFINNI